MIALIVRFKVKDGCAEQMLACLAENARHSNEEPGCRKWEFSRRLDDPSEFAIYEIYDDLEAIQAHLDSEHFAAWKAVAPELWEWKESAKYEIL